MCKYIFVTGGVVSGLGKGITAASIGRLLVARGIKVKVQKLDPYLNVDPGTMSPYEHGEVFVTEDGTETDLDLGHYERFIELNTSRTSTYSGGNIYSRVLEKERRGDYLGKTVQLIPHVTNEMKDVIKNNARGADVCIVELGGTVGDFEGLIFLEAIRQLRVEVGLENSLSVHVVLLPYLEASEELKTRPAQYSCKDLMGFGIIPNIVVCRTSKNVELSKENKAKIAMFCNLKSSDYVIHNYDANSIYEVPLIMKEQKVDELVLKELSLKAKRPNLTQWTEMTKKITSDLPVVRIAVVGKYTSVPDAYISVSEAIKHACLKENVKAEIKFVNSEEVEKLGAEKLLNDVDGVIVPGGFGIRGVEGKILTSKFARENEIPYLGICLGMQVAVIDFARNVIGLKDANSSEFASKTNNPVIDIMEEQKTIKKMGGTSRLGAYDCELEEESLALKLYNKKRISERHRHRYEFNSEFELQFKEAGMIFSGKNKELDLVEVIELKDHPFFIATQFHPEFKSRPLTPHPLFVGLAKAVKNTKWLG